MANEFTSAADSAQRPVPIFGPDFPFLGRLDRAAGLGSIPRSATARKLPSSGAGMSGMVAAYELMKLGLRPVVYEASPHGWPVAFTAIQGAPTGVIAELGGMRFPVSSTAFYHYVDLLGLELRRFPTRLRPRPTARLSILKVRRITPSSPTHCRRYSRR